MKAKTFVIGFVAVLAGAVAASVYFNLTATRPQKTVTAVASPDGRYKAVRVSLTQGGACFDTISVYLSVYPDSFAEREKTYRVYSGPCAPEGARADLPKMQWLSDTALRITYPAVPAGAKRTMEPMDASNFVHVTYAARQ
ncbi:MAG: hypothetical protein P8Y53_11865 [Pseudolabrys sp.]